ncbi:MAG: OmpA family protein [Brevundimonas sp.]
MKRLGIAAVGAALAVAGCSFAGRDALVTDPAGCAEQRLDIYFEEGEARIARPARDLIALTGQRLQACRIEGVEVIGLASATGDPARNLTLSERRATAVADAMREAGWPAPQFTLSAAGEAGAMTGDGLAEPLRRRTVIVVRARPR